MNASRYVLDSFAIMAFLHKEQGWEKVRAMFNQAVEGRVELHVSVLNLAEVQYLTIRRGEDTPQVRAAINGLPLHVASADEYVPDVVRLKASYAVSLADCFAAALAVRLDCPLVTADHEFRKMEDILSVEWLR